MSRAAFVATLGAAPQVVTLTLDALLAQNVPVERVVVVHTLPDRPPIQDALPPLEREFLQARSYPARLVFVPHLLAGENGPLADVVTPEEIDTAFQSLYTLLRQLKYAGYQVHLSLAGGRKTLALLAMAAAQVVLSSEDSLWHLVSPPALRQSQKLHAPRPDAVTLVPIPIVRWGRQQPQNRSRAQDFIAHELTPAEREIVMLLLREGLSNSALAKRLDKSPKTVSNQLSRIYAKLQAYYNLTEPPDRVLLLVLLGNAPYPI